MADFLGYVGPDNPAREGALFYCGACCYRRSHHQLALEQFQALNREYPGSPFGGRAQLTTALCEIRMGRRERALKTLTGLVSTAPQSPEAPKTQFLIGWLHLYRQEYDASRQALQAVVREHPGTSYARKAADMLARLPEE